MKQVVICPGHYNNYKGVSKNGFIEHNICIEIISSMKKQSELVPDIKLIVVMGTLFNKITKICSISPDLAIEVHLGNSNNLKICGSRSFFAINNETSKKLADFLINSCSNILNTTNNGTWVGWYKKIGPKLVKLGRAPEGWKPKIDLFLSRIPCTSAIIEPFFISSSSDCKKFTSQKSIDTVAKALLLGLKDYVDQIRTA